MSLPLIREKVKRGAITENKQNDLTKSSFTLLVDGEAPSLLFVIFLSPLSIKSLFAGERFGMVQQYGVPLPPKFSNHYFRKWCLQFCLWCLRFHKWCLCFHKCCLCFCKWCLQFCLWCLRFHKWCLRFCKWCL